MSEKHYNKLIRDNIPDIIKNAGKEPHVYVADSKEYHERLLEKLHEEITEYKESQNPEELADIMEVIEALTAYHGVDPKTFMSLKDTKKTKNGGFEKRLVLTKVTDNEG